MSTPIVIQGTLKPDGTLELDEKVNLPAGRVQVLVQPLPQLPADDPFWQSMQSIWDAQKGQGHLPRTREQIDAELQGLEDEAEAEMRAVETLHQECRQAREQAAGSGGQPP